MKIGIFCDSFLPDNKAVSIRVYHLANALVQVNSTVNVHTCTRATGGFQFSIRKNLLSAPSSDSGAMKRLFAELLLGVETFFRILFCRYDLVILSSPPFFTSCLGAIAANIRFMPYVFDVRDEYPEVYFSAGLVKSHRLAGRLLLGLERFIYKKSFLIITVTEGIGKRIGEKVGNDKVKLVRNGFDNSLFYPAEVKYNEFTVVFHGNIGKFQNPDLIVGIAKLANDRKLPIAFKVIGWGNNDDSLKSASLSNLSFYGMVEYEKIPENISKAHLGISFRTSDIISINSFPVKLYEYIGVGLPTIVTPISEAGEFIEKNGLGYQFSGNNAEEILDKIIFLYNNPEVLQAVTEKVRLIRLNFSRQEISHSFATLLINQFKESYA